MPVFQPLDWLVVAAYFLLLGVVAVWVMRQKTESATDYFLAGRHVGWFVIGASIFASNIGSEHIVGLAGTAYNSGMVMGHYELHSWLVLTLGWVFVPFYMRSRVFTMPEFLEMRYGPVARWLLSVTTLVAYVLTKISVTIYAGAVVFQTLMGIDFWTGRADRGAGHRGVHGDRRVARGSVHGGLAGHRSDRRFGHRDRGRTRQGGRLVRARREPGRDPLQHVPASRSSRVPVDRDDLCAAHRQALVLVHRSVHRATRIGCKDESAARPSLPTWGETMEVG